MEAEKTMTPNAWGFYLVDGGDNFMISDDLGVAVGWLKGRSLDGVEIMKFERDVVKRWVFSQVSWKTICERLVGGEER